jgi:hypothetical protein
MDRPQFVAQTEPSAAFDLLSDDTRVAILRALWTGACPMTFSELRGAVGVADSGQFNYHLNKLVGQFVSKGDAGYELTTAGSRINGAIEAGSYTTDGVMDPIPLEQPCPACGGARTFRYKDDTAQVECDSCALKIRYPVPPSVFADCNRKTIPTVAGEYLRMILDQLASGFCSLCEGPVDQTVCQFSESAIGAEDVADSRQDPDQAVIVQYECLQCGAQPASILGLDLLAHPAVVSFYYDRGVDLRKRSFWQLSALDPGTTQLRGTQPFRAEQTYTVAGDELTMVVDDEMTVIDQATPAN